MHELTLGPARCTKNVTKATVQCCHLTCTGSIIYHRITRYLMQEASPPVKMTTVILSPVHVLEGGGLHAQVLSKRCSVGEQSLSHEQREGERHQEWVPVEQHPSVIGERIDLQRRSKSAQRGIAILIAIAWESCCKKTGSLSCCVMTRQNEAWWPHRGRPDRDTSQVLPYPHRNKDHGDQLENPALRSARQQD